MSNISYRSAPDYTPAPYPPGFVNVKDFGALGDNVNDTDAIQAAVDYLNIWGGTLYFPPGTYRVLHGFNITKDGVHVRGAGRRSTTIQFEPSGTASLWLFEQDNPVQHCGIFDISLQAGVDTTNTKIAVDLHDVRFFIAQNVEVQSWTGSGSVGIRLRGRDNNMLYHVRLDAEIPLQIAINDRDTTKDLDHTYIGGQTALICRSATKIGIDIQDQTVLRNTTFEGIALVQGYVRWVDTIAPRRRSTCVRFSNIRVEGLTEEGITPAFAIDIQKHKNGRLQTLTLDNVLMGEGSDARFGVNLGAAWGGVRANGVLRTELRSCRYGGRSYPFVSDGIVTYSSSQLVPEDAGRAIPEHESQWDLLGILRPRSWWIMRNAAANPMADEQDETLGAADIPLDEQSPGTLPVHQVLRDGFHGFHAQFTGEDFQRLRLNTTDTEFDPNARSMALLAYLEFSTVAPAGNVEVLSVGGGSNGPRLRMDSAGKLFLSSNGVNGTVSTNTYLDGQLVCAWLVHNRTGTTTKCRLRKFDGTEEVITVTYSATVGNDINKGAGSGISGQLAYTGYIRFLACFLNANAEQNESTVMTNLGWET